MKQVIILLGFSSGWQVWILFKRDYNPIGFSSWHQEMDKYFTTENRHARHNSGSTALARDKFQCWVYMMQHEVWENYSDLCNRGRPQLCSIPVSPGNRSEQTYSILLMQTPWSNYTTPISGRKTIWGTLRPEVWFGNWKFGTTSRLCSNC